MALFPASRSLVSGLLLATCTAMLCAQGPKLPEDAGRRAFRALGGEAPSLPGARLGEPFVASTAPATRAVARVAVNDINGDGRSDLLWRNSATGSLYLMPMNGLGVMPGGIFWTEADTTWQIVGTGDLDGDGKADLVWYNSSNGMVYGMLMNGAAVKSGGIAYQEPNSTWRIIAVKDFNGDGKADLLWRNTVSGAVYLLPMNGLTAQPGAIIWQEPDLNWEIVGAADFDGDGKADLLWRNRTTGLVYLILMDGTTVRQGKVLHSEPDPAWTIQGLGDVNGDGSCDIIWRNTTTGSVYVLLVSGGTVSGGAIVHTEPSFDWQIVRVGDYDGDGKDDLVWYNAQTGMVYGMLMDGLSIKSRGVVWSEPDTRWSILTEAKSTACVWRFDATAPPSWLAYQDGMGAWTPVTGQQGVYRFSLTQGKGAVAYVQPGVLGSHDVHLLYGGETDLAAQDLRTPAGDNLSVWGTFAGLGTTESADLNLGDEGYAYASGGSGTYYMDFVNKGLHDLVAVRFDATNVPKAVVVHRNLDVQASGSLGVAGSVDFATEGGEVTTSTLTPDGVVLSAGQLLRTWESFVTPHGAAFLRGQISGVPKPMPIHGLPAAQPALGDRQVVAIQVGQDLAGSMDPDNARTSWTYLQTVGDLSLAAPADPALPTATVAATSPYVRFRLQGAFTSDLNAYLTTRFTQGSLLTWTSTVLPSYTSGALDVTFPDFSTLAGWSASWGMVPGTDVTCRREGGGQTWSTWPPAQDGARSFLTVKSATLVP